MITRLRALYGMKNSITHTHNMEKIEAYRKLLPKMYLMERLGANLYKQLAAREKDIELKDIYTRLSDNENETGKIIDKEIELHLPNYSKENSRLTANTISLFFQLLPNMILSKILKDILNKRMYSRWFELYNDYNPQLWHTLKEHEQLQHKLLTILE